jgi:Zn finger protein HypA/HybF involved in hydrogenase expression
MPTRRIGDCKEPNYFTCQDPDHNPPKMVALEPGEYEHKCPRCHKIYYFVVRGRDL